MVKNIKKKDLEFEKILQVAEDPKNIGQGSWACPENPTPVEEIKYNLCQEILSYKLINNLMREQIIGRIGLNQSEVEDILFCRLSKFSLDTLTEVAGKLFAPSHLKIIIEENKSHVRTI